MKRIGLFIITAVYILTLFSCTPSRELTDFDKDLRTHVNFSAQYIRTGGYHETEQYPQVRIIESKRELNDYYTKYRDYYQLDRAEELNFFEAIKRYDDTYFRERFLLMVLLEEPSGSNRHRVEEIYLQDDRVTVNISRLIPEWCDDDMALWHLLIEPEIGTRITDEDAVMIRLERKEAHEWMWD